MIDTLVCQSCAMPLEKDEDFSTNADGLKNKEYCLYCYKAGEFIEPELTLEEMLESIDSVMEEMDISEENIEKTKLMISELKRWKK